MDQGGTFTDVLRLSAEGRLRVEKVPSDQGDLQGLARGVGAVRRGTTVATNALLEGRGAPVLLLVSQGFADLPWIGDQTRPSLFSLAIERPAPLCTQVLEVEGRIGADGEVIAPAAVDRRALQAAFDGGIRSVAVCLVHGPSAPEEERQIGRLAAEIGFPHVALGHEVAPSRGFFARLCTTLADAALSPLLPRADGLYMRSDGGLSGAGDADWRGSQAVLSGPAGGVVAVAALCRRAGEARAFGLDMGGTSTDVCRVEGGPTRVDHLRVNGLLLRVSAVEIETVAAGGGSVLGLRAGGYAIGPESAGAHPGPASYGRGGPAALTDVEAVLGRLPGFPAVCGPSRDGPLDLDAARRAVAALDPRRPVEAVAAGFREVAAERMAGAIRRLAAAHGVDPADHVLVAFGGAGPAHATSVARRLGVRVVLVPFLAGVFSAVGIGVAGRRAERVEPVRGDMRAAAEVTLRDLPFTGVVGLRLAARVVGTSELIEVLVEVGELPPGPELTAGLLERFGRAHRARFGFDRPGEAVEAVELRASVESEEAELNLPAAAVEAGGPTDTLAYFDGWQRVPLREMRAADGLVGPCILTGGGCTVVVEPGWRVCARGDHLRLEDEAPARLRLGLAADPVHTAVLGARLMAVAEQMGERLARLARSVSIRERRDFSAAVFDAEGQLVCNAPHVPVHLGAMGETVRDLRRARALQAGQVWVCNDPYAGGSHLPDITVIQPVFDDRGRVLAFVACRGHHVDVGGLTPGSMPPFSRDIAEEGLVLRHLLLAERGRFITPPLPGCRQPETVCADLQAQVAACSLGERLIQELALAVGAEALRAQMGHLMDAAEASVRALLRGREGTFRAEERLDDGTLIGVTLRVEGGEGWLTVTGPSHPGNRNAPRAVAQACLLYVLRCLVGLDLPLNEGALRPLHLELEPGGLFDPSPPRAVAGGNVETSQRLTDALLRALGAQAASQGTMNNLTVGTAAGAWYETIGGGGGAGPGFEGGDAVQVHMTNTRATDVEELETRFPVRLESWRRRRGSGGPGQYRGGDGVEKVWRFLAPATVALLASRRDRGAPGLEGGGDGAPGVDERDVGHGWEPAPCEWRAEAGHRLRISTPGGGGFGRASKGQEGRG